MEDKLHTKKLGPSIVLRLCISLAAIVLPIAFLTKGIYGSFLFSFSIPLLWQIGFLGESFSSLGLRRKFIKSSIIIGIISGCVLGLFGGNILKLSGVTGYAFTNLDKLEYSFKSFNISFQLQKELGYQLLTMSNTFVGTGVYLIFSIFVIGLGEELLWRGFIQKKVSNHFSKNVSIWLTAFLFTLMHFYIFIILPFKAGVFFLVLIAIVGVVWGYLFEHFNNIWCPAISHGIVAFVIWKYYFFTP